MCEGSSTKLGSLCSKQRLKGHVSMSFVRMQAVMCNDCGKRGEAPFHFVYHKCVHCASYNTRVV